MFRQARRDAPPVAVCICCWLALMLVSGCADPEAAAPTPLNQEAVAASAPETAGQFVPPFELGAGFPAGVVTASRAAALQEGAPVPEFALAFADGTRLSTPQLAGRALLINFWATWCGPCRHEIPIILEQQDRYPEDLLVLAVNVKEDRAAVTDFAAEFAMHIPVILDPPGDIVRQFDVRAYPTSIFVDARGHLVARWQGVLDAAKLEELVQATLTAVE